MSGLTLLQAVLIGLTGLVMVAGAVIGALLPIPGSWLIWLCALGYGLVQPAFGHAAFDGWIGGSALVVLTLLALVDLGLEYVVTHSVMREDGVSAQARWASLGLGLLGLPLFPPVGPLVGALGGLFAVEYFRRGRDWRAAWAAVVSYARGWGWSMFVELLLGLAMIGVWLAWVTLALAFPPAS